MSQILEVKTTFARHQDAVEVARKLVEEHLCACAQILPGLESIYRWEGMLRHDEEVMVLFKTTEIRWPALRDRLAALHPYDTPEIIAIPVVLASFDYISWVRDSSG